MRIPLPRRIALLAPSSLVFGTGRARAQPRSVVERTARVVVGYPPGGPTDTVARLVAERLRGTYAPTVVVENRPGAAGRLGVEAVKAAAPDGTTLLFTPATVMTIFPHVYPRTTRYDALADFAPVSPVCASPYAFAVRSDHPARDLAAFAAWAKAQRDPAPFGSPAAGAGPHFVGVKLARALGIELTHVPYRGTAPLLQDLLAGQVPAMALQVGDVAELHRAGQARILGVTAEARLPALPDVPSFAELGHPDMTGEEWFGVLLPARAPAPVVEGLHMAIAAATATPELREALGRQQFRVFTRAPAEFAAQIRAEREAWAPVVQASGFNAEE
ncbi:tripartite tricarboxylate transporter substrate-binding protein [Roseomonas sp. CCTCC AB2023176]|uniref:tripartite tricarboxylate transporter substrate-binding protein n=1 Tax=Roseomonas sp. CCTCC AB2023176 TaxID=3342640 RepID=UPI0035D71D68